MIEATLIEDLRVELITPGGMGNPIQKPDGEQFGARISFNHWGAAIALDAGWAAHLGETYCWAVGLNVTIDAHTVKTRVSIPTAGIWGRPSTIAEGQRISAQAVISKAGNISGYPPIADDLGLPIRPIWTPKLSSTLSEVKALLEKTYADVYQAIGPGLMDIGIEPW